MCIRDSYEEVPPTQAGVPRGKYNLSGVLLHRTTVEGDPKVILSIPAAVAELVTQLKGGGGDGGRAHQEGDVQNASAHHGEIQEEAPG
eukprot:3943662-Amphidinium_carterae.1